MRNSKNIKNYFFKNLCILIFFLLINIPEYSGATNVMYSQEPYQEISEGTVFYVPIYADILNISGYQLKLEYDPETIWLQEVEPTKIFAPRPYYYTKYYGYNSIEIIEFLVHTDAININDNIIYLRFKALKPTNLTEINISKLLITNEDGIAQSYISELIDKRTILQKIKIIPESEGISIRTNKAGFFTMLENYGDSKYDVTGDGKYDINDLVWFSRQVQESWIDSLPEREKEKYHEDDIFFKYKFVYTII
jgi:hypothetical protein